jgi:hypothetical protein
MSDPNQTPVDGTPTPAAPELPTLKLRAVRHDQGAACFLAAAIQPAPAEQCGGPYILAHVTKAGPVPGLGFEEKKILSPADAVAYFARRGAEEFAAVALVYQALRAAEAPADNALDGKYVGEVRKVDTGVVVPPDEWILFRVTDKALVATMTDYHRHCGALGAGAAHLAGVDRLIGRVHTWQEAHPDRVKVPD